MQADANGAGRYEAEVHRSKTSRPGSGRVAPIEPPIHLQQRLEETLDSLVEFAAEELESWEPKRIKDPRNWPRAAVRPRPRWSSAPAAAVGLVVLRTRRDGTSAARKPTARATSPSARSTDAMREARKFSTNCRRDTDPRAARANVGEMDVRALADEDLIP